MKYELKNKVLVVTGASQGIGEAIARQFAKKGCKVVLAARSMDKLMTITNELIEGGGNAIAMKTDVSKVDEIQNLVKDVLEHYGRINIWINNAGFGIHYNAIYSKPEWVNALFNVNLHAVYWGMRFAGQEMVKNKDKIKGIIVNISSLATELPITPNSVLYNVAKVAVDKLSEGMTLELNNFNIKVINVKPGFTASNFGDNLLAGRRTGKDYNREGFLMFKAVGPEVVAEKIVKEVQKGKSNKRVIITKSDRFNVGLVKTLGALVNRFIKKEFLKEKPAPP